MTKLSHFYGFCHRNMVFRPTKMAKKYAFTPLFFNNKYVESKTNNMHDVASYLLCILIFAKIGRHVDGHFRFLRPHHDSRQSPSIFLHLRYVPNHLWNNFLWTSHAHRHPLRDCTTRCFLVCDVLVRMFLCCRPLVDTCGR